MSCSGRDRIRTESDFYLPKSDSQRPLPLHFVIKPGPFISLNSPSQHLQSVTPVVAKMFKSADAVVIIHYSPHAAAAEAGCEDLPHLCERLQIDCLLDKVEDSRRQHKTGLVPQQQRPVSSGGSVIQHLCVEGHPSFSDIHQSISFVQPPRTRIENHRVHRKIKSTQQIIEMRFQAVLFDDRKIP